MIKIFSGIRKWRASVLTSCGQLCKVQAKMMHGVTWRICNPTGFIPVVKEVQETSKHLSLNVYLHRGKPGGR